MAAYFTLHPFPADAAGPNWRVHRRIYRVHGFCTPESVCCLPVLSLSFRRVLVLRFQQSAKTRINAALNGAAGENRTHDLSLTKESVHLNFARNLRSLRGFTSLLHALRTLGSLATAIAVSPGTTWAYRVTALMLSQPPSTIRPFRSR